MTLDLDMRILPVPRQVERYGSGWVSVAGVQIENRVDDPRLVPALDEFRRRTSGRRGWAAGGGATVLRVAVERGCVPYLEGYRLHIREGVLELFGGSAAGCFYGLKTLTQLLERLPTSDALPCCTIGDWPDFDTRGLLHDVTRGKVPTLDTLKLLADRLSQLKVNQLQLYIEHAFAFAFDPEICDADHGLTPDEVRELDRYCLERFITLVPAVANLGHMGRILSLPRYRHLAEIESTQSWEEMSWPERARGLTLDCVNPESWELVERIWSEILDCFSSPVVNICGDEPWDLGKGRNRHLQSPRETGATYLQHIRRVHAFCAARGRRTQFWSDVVRNHPDLFDRVPRGSTVLHWGYDDRADYEGTELFVETGLDTVICPGTSGWKRILNAVDLAERNIHTFAATGDRHGATGLLNTDWGDHGHFNTLACSWHGIASGAVHGWRADHTTGAAFDALFADLGWGLCSVEEVGLFRAASRIAESCETWRLLWQPLSTTCQEPAWPTLDSANVAADAARRLRALLEERRSPGAVSDVDRRELATACRFTELFAERAAMARVGEEVDVRRGGGRATPGVVSSEGATAANAVPENRRVGAGETFRRELREAWGVYEAVWADRNKASGLADIGSALARVAEDCDSSAGCVLGVGSV